jgi:predicted PurR-regulated permease PerM
MAANPDEDKEIERTSFSKKILIATSIAALIIILVLVSKAAFNVFLLILAGVLIAVYFRGLSYWLEEKTKLTEKQSLATVIAGTLTVVTLVFWLMGAKIQQQMTSLTKQLPSSSQEFKKKISQYEWGKQLVKHSKGFQKKFSNNSKVLNAIKKVFKSSFGILGDLYVILFIAIFFTATPMLYKNSILALIPPDRKEAGNNVLHQIGYTLRDWLIGKVFAMIVVAILTAIGLLIIGVPMALALALIAGILNFIPNFGPLIAMIPAVLIGLSKGTTTALIVAGLYFAIQVAESNFITPLVQKRLIKIPPAYIIIGQVTMGMLTGGLGLILATPFIAILMVLIQTLYIDRILKQ